jgi:hypothetical protein
LSALTFALIILFSGKLERLAEEHKRYALSFFGGVAAAYVFLDLLPSLRQAGEYLKQVTGGSQLVGFYEDAIFLIVFVGFLIFFVLEHLAKRSRKKGQVFTKQHYSQVSAAKRLFIVHFISFAFINLVLSYLLFFEFQSGIVRGLLFAFAVALHIVISSDSMVEHYRHQQMKIGRYVGALIPLFGWAASMMFPERLAEAYVLLALISGAILYNSIKNEVPSAARKQSLLLFLVGSLFYALLIFVHAIVTA